MCLAMYLMDASGMGEKIKVNGKIQKTILSKNEVNLIQDMFLNQISKDDFSITVDIEDIKNKKYSFSAGQYFDIKIEQTFISKDEFSENIKEISKDLDDLFRISASLDEKIKKQIGDIKYE